jgi:hypothetical protein
VGNEIRKILLHSEPVALITGMGEENNFHPLLPKQYLFKSPHTPLFPPGRRLKGGVRGLPIFLLLRDHQNRFGKINAQITMERGHHIKPKEIAVKNIVIGSIHRPDLETLGKEKAT